MSAPGNCQLIGRWRITEADLWDRNHLDLCGPATIIIGKDGHGEIEFGALQAGLDLEYGRSIVFFSRAISLSSPRSKKLSAATAAVATVETTQTTTNLFILRALSEYAAIPVESIL